MSVLHLTVQLSSEEEEKYNSKDIKNLNSFSNNTIVYEDGYLYAVFNIVLSNKDTSQQIVISKYWIDILKLDEVLRHFYPVQMTNVINPSEISGVQQPKVPISQAGKNPFKNIKRWFNNNPNSTAVHQMTNCPDPGVFSPTNPSIQAVLDKIALYFQGILMNNELAGSTIFKKFMNVISEPETVRKRHPPMSLTTLQSRANPISKLSESNKLALEHFHIIRVLGKGCMGKVFLAKFMQTNQLFALKSIHKKWVLKNREVEHTRAERDILVKLSMINHPFLVRMNYSFQTNTELFLVLDYYPGGDLATLLARNQRFMLEQSTFYAAEVVLGIAELHRLGIVYRDLKPENVLIKDTGHIALTDFGLSKWLPSQDQSSTGTFCGTAEYLAPEVLLSENYDFAVDWWSFGTLLYEMLTGITPFWHENQAKMYARVLNDPLEFPSCVSSETARDFISKLLQRNPRDRIGDKDLEEIKNHLFFSKLNWDRLYKQDLIPPFIPDLIGDTDASNFDETFTAMSPKLTPSPDDKLSPSAQKSFLGFSFDGRA